MGKLMACQETKYGEKNYIAGIVNYVREGLEGRVMNFGINVSVYNEGLQNSTKCYMNLAAWNSNDPEKTQMADKFRDEGIEEGDFILVQTGDLEEEDEPANDGTPVYKASVWRIIKSGKIGLPGETQDDERTIIIGTIAETVSNGDYFTVTIPIKSKRYRKVAVDDYQITFSNSENYDRADEARERLEKGMPCAILCGRIRRQGDEIKLWGIKMACGIPPSEAAA